MLSSRALLLTFLLDAAAALDHTGLVQASLERTPEAPATVTTRMELGNYVDMQYFASVSMGSPPQKLTAIIDTGSFEFVVFTANCDGCGMAAKYNQFASRTHSRGNLVTELRYGSGVVTADELSDWVSLGSFEPSLQSFWAVRKAEMDLLFHASFNSILGLGPPEGPASESWAEEVEAVQAMASHFRKNRMLSRAPARMADQVERGLQTAMAVGSHRAVLDAFRTNTFSMCLGEKPGSSGYIVWNDTLAFDQPQLFTRLPVIGKHTWTAHLSDVHLVVAGPSSSNVSPSIGCEAGCAAVLDSGTSLLIAPKASITHLAEALDAINYDCKSAGRLPSIALTMSGQQFTLPPGAYASQRDDSAGCRLELAAVESTAHSDLGPLWILGMPFLRRYYTTFHVGSDSGSRSLLVAPASSQCMPAKPGFVLAADRSRPTMRTFRREHMHITPMAYRATTETYVRL